MASDIIPIDIPPAAPGIVVLILIVAAVAFSIAAWLLFVEDE